MSEKISHNLSDLFKEARQYGLVYIHTLNDGSYHSCITFNSIEHTSLKALSRFDHVTPEEAITFALHKAKEIVASMSNLKTKLDQNKLLK